VNLAESVNSQVGRKKKGAWQNHTRLPLRMDQLFVYLRDHLLLDKSVETRIIKPSSTFSSSSGCYTGT
jgi:hypothetical protein